jgi:hypothetical protein
MRGRQPYLLALALMVGEGSKNRVAPNRAVVLGAAIFLVTLLALSIVGVFATMAGATGTQSLTSTADTKIVENTLGQNYGTVTSLGVNGNIPNGSGKDQYALLKWDVSGIAPGTQVGSALVTLNITTASSQTYQAYVLKQPWVEKSSTWNVYDSGKPWEVAGAKGSLDRNSTIVGTITPSAKGKKSFTLPSSVVQGWVSNPATNQGIIIANPSSTRGFEFNSREVTDPTRRPQLTLDLVADTSPPETTITSGAADGELLTVNSATFEFSSSEAGSTFECSLDGGTFSSCSSPKGYTDLLNGSHTFEVRATDAAGNTDPTPASTTFSVEVPLPPPLVQCADGVDNDGDGSKDYPADPGCLDAADNDETDPAPPPTPGQLLWDAGAEKQMDQEWAELSTADNCALRTYPGITDSRISRVASPVSTGTYAYRVFLKDGDNCFNERAELGMNLPDRSDMQDRLFREGEERWVAFSVYPAEGFQLNVPTSSWWVTMQMKNGNLGGGPIIEMDPLNGQWVFKRDTNDPSNPNPSGFTSRFTLGAVNKFAWNKFLWHIKFSSDPSVGYVEVYGDLADGQGMRQLLPLTRGATLKIDSNTGAVPPSGVRIGTYRDKALSGDATTYFDSFTVATSRARAESAL